MQTQTVTVPMPITPAAAVAPSTTLKTAAFETAVTEAKSAKANPKGAMITYAEFVSPTGEYYVPVSLTVRGAAGLNPEAADTVFGVVDQCILSKVLNLGCGAKSHFPSGTLLMNEYRDLNLLGLVNL